MMSESDGTSRMLNRRSLLRKSGATLVTSSMLMSTSMASPNGKSHTSGSKQIGNAQCELCTTVLASSDEATLLRIPNVKMDDATLQKATKAGEATRKARQSGEQVDPEVTNFQWEVPDYDDEFLIRVNKKDSVIEGKLVQTEQLDALDTSNISVSADGLQLAGSNDISTMDRLDVYVKDYQWWSEKYGSCGGVTVPHHHSLGIAIHTGESFSRITGATLGGILCSLAPSGWIAKLGGEVFGGGACAAIGSEIYNFLGPSSDIRGSWGMWDIHRGWGNAEHLARGHAEFWTETHSNMTKTYDVAGLHTGSVLGQNTIDTLSRQYPP